MAASSPTPLQRYLRVQRIADRDLARVLRDAAEEGQRIVDRLARSGRIGDQVTRAEKAIITKTLRDHQAELWGSITDSTRQAMSLAGKEAAEGENLLRRVLFESLGGPMLDLEEAMRVRAEESIQNYIARTENGISFSHQVYKTKALTNGLVDREVNRSILLGESAKQLGNRVKKFISPTVPGGVSYAASRLGRTELNNAFHRAQINQRIDEPWTEGMQWHLSGSHPRPDACNDYAERSHFKGGDAGVFKPSDVPGKPHPNCLCYVTTVQVSEEEFLDRFISGQYDTYIDEQIYKYAPDTLSGKQGLFTSPVMEYTTQHPRKMKESGMTKYDLSSREKAARDRGRKRKKARRRKERIPTTILHPDSSDR